MKVLRRASVSIRFIAFSLIAVFLTSILMLDFLRLKNSDAAALDLPAHNKLLSTSPEFSLAQLKGLKINPDNPYDLTFIIDHGDQSELNQSNAEELVRFFMAALTIPQKDLWVNLSPYEEERVIEKELSKTELGEVFLKQDYVLKQLSSSLTDPETQIGKSFWNGSLNKQGHSFNKIWISPRKSELYINGRSVLINSASLKVETEEDYLAMQKNGIKDKSSNTKAILQELDREVNKGKHFAQLRQVYNALILANWFKKTLKESVYSSYINNKQVAGIDLADADIKEKVWQLYCKSFKEGVYNKIQKENNIKRSYFSGGLGFEQMGEQVFAASPIIAGQGEVSELKVKTKKDSQPSIKQRLWYGVEVGSAMSELGITDDSLSKLFKESFFNRFSSKQELAHIKAAIKDKDLKAISFLLKTALKGQYGMKSTKDALLKIIAEKDLSKELPIAKMDVHHLEALHMYIYARAFGLKLHFYETKNGPVLLTNKFGAKNNVIVDIVTGRVMKMPNKIRELYDLEKDYNVINKKKLSGFDHSQSSFYSSESNKILDKMTTADLYMKYTYFKKVEIVRLVDEVRYDVAYAFRKVGDAKSYNSLSKKSPSWQYRRDSILNQIPKYKKATTDNSRNAILKVIDREIQNLRFDKSMLLELAKFYLDIGDFTRHEQVFLNLYKTEPSNILNYIYRAESLLFQYERKAVIPKWDKKMSETLDWILMLEPDVVLRQLEFLNLSLLNALTKRNSKFFNQNSGDISSDIHNALTLLYTTANKDENKDILKAIDKLRTLLFKGQELPNDLINQLNEAGVPLSLYNSIRDMVGIYNIEINKSAVQGQLTAEAEEMYKSEIKAVTDENNALVQERDSAVKAININQQKAQSIIDDLLSEKEQMEIQHQKEMSDLRNMMANAELKHRKELEGQRTVVDRRVAQLEESLKQAQSKLDALGREKSSEFTVLKSKLGDTFDEIFQVKKLDRRNPKQAMDKALEAVGRALNVKAWFFDVFPENDLIEFKADAQYGFETSNSFFKDRQPAKNGEKRFVGDIYNAFYKVYDDNDAIIATDNSHRKSFIEKFNSEYGHIAFLYASPDFKQLGISILDRTQLSEIDEEYINPGEADSTGGYAGDLAKFGAVVPNEKLKQLGFLFTDEHTMAMWNQWLPVDSPYSPLALSKQEKQLKLSEVFTEYQKAKEWFNDKIEQQRNIDTLENQLKESRKESGELKDKLHKSNFDSLTKFYTRTYFDTYGDVIVDEAAKVNRPLTSIMLDIDKFKNFNDTYGHQMGDKVITEVSKVIQSIVDEVDGAYAFRYGGEELLCVMPLGLEETLALAERIRAAIAAHSVKNDAKGPEYLTVTTSQGVASLGQVAMQADLNDVDEKGKKIINFERSYLRDEAGNSLTINNIRHLVSTADTYLYAAKKHGRNNVVYMNSQNDWRFVRDGKDMSSEQIKQLPSLYEDQKVEELVKKEEIELKEGEAKVVEDINATTETAEVAESGKKETAENLSIDKSILNAGYVNRIIGENSSARLLLEWANNDDKRAEALKKLKSKNRALKDLKAKLEIWQDNSELQVAFRVLIDRTLPKIQEELDESMDVVAGVMIETVENDVEVFENSQTSYHPVERRSATNSLPSTDEALIVIEELNFFMADLQEHKIAILASLNNGSKLDAKIMNFDSLLDTIDRVQVVHASNIDVSQEEDVIIAREEFNFHRDEIESIVRKHKEELDVKERVMDKSNELLPLLTSLTNDLVRYNEKHELYHSTMNKFNKAKKEAEKLIYDDLGFQKDQQLVDNLHKLEEKKNECLELVHLAIEKQEIIKTAKDKLDLVVEQAIRSNKDYLRQYNDILGKPLPEVMRNKRIQALKNSKVSFVLDSLDDLMDYLAVHALSFRMTSRFLEVLDEYVSFYDDVENVTGKGKIKSKKQVTTLLQSVKDRARDEGDISEMSFESLVKHLESLNVKFKRPLPESADDLLAEEDFEEIETSSYDETSNSYLKEINSKDTAKDFLKTVYTKINSFESELLDLRGEVQRAGEGDYKEKKSSEYLKKYEELVTVLEAIGFVINREFAESIQKDLKNEYSNITNTFAVAGLIKTSPDESYVQLRSGIEELVDSSLDLAVVLSRLKNDSGILEESSYSKIAEISSKSFFTKIESIHSTLKSGRISAVEREKIEMSFYIESNIINFFYEAADFRSMERGVTWDSGEFLNTIYGQLDNYIIDISKRMSRLGENIAKADIELEGDAFGIDKRGKIFQDSGFLREVFKRVYNSINNFPMPVALDEKGGPNLTSAEVETIASLQMLTTKIFDESGILDVVNGGPMSRASISIFRPTTDFFDRHQDATPFYGHEKDSDSYMVVLEEDDADLFDNVNVVENAFEDYIESLSISQTYSSESIKMMSDYFFQLVILQGGKVFGFDVGEKIADGLMEEEDYYELFETYTKFMDMSFMEFYKKNSETLKKINITQELKASNLVQEIANKLNISLPNGKFYDRDLFNAVHVTYPYLNFDDWGFIWSTDYTNEKYLNFIYRYAKKVNKLIGLMNGFDLKSSRLFSNFTNGIFSQDVAALIKISQENIKDLPKYITDVTLVEYGQEKDVEEQQEREDAKNENEVPESVESIQASEESYQEQSAEEQALAKKQARADQLLPEVERQWSLVQQAFDNYSASLKGEQLSAELRTAYVGHRDTMLEKLLPKFSSLYDEAEYLTFFSGYDTLIQLWDLDIKQLEYPLKVNAINANISSNWAKLVEVAGAYIKSLQSNADQPQLKESYLSIWQTISDELIPSLKALNMEEAMINIKTMYSQQFTALDKEIKGYEAATNLALANEKKYLNMAKFVQFSDNLKQAYKSFSTDISDLEANYDLLLSGVDVGDMEVAPGDAENYEAIKAELNDAQQRYSKKLALMDDFGVNTSSSISGGLDFGSSSSVVQGKLAELNWTLDSAQESSAMSFEVVSFKEVDKKTVLASL